MLLGTVYTLDIKLLCTFKLLMGDSLLQDPNFLLSMSSNMQLNSYGYELPSYPFAQPVSKYESKAWNISTVTLEEICFQVII